MCSYSWKANQYFNQVEKQSTDWMLSYGAFDERVRERLVSTNAGLLAVYVYTYADYDALRTCSDFFNLLFMLDEVSDDQDVTGVRETRDAFVNALNGTYDEESVVSRSTRE